MRLKFKYAKYSIKDFPDTDLPVFTVLTGINGAGKTHFLKSIKEGGITADNLLKDDILLFDPESFRMVENSSQEHDEQLSIDWQIFNGNVPSNTNTVLYKHKHISTDWILAAKEIFNDIFDNDLANHYNFWPPDTNNPDKYEKYIEYQDRIESEIFEHPNFNGFPTSIFDVFRKRRRAIHTIEEEDFRLSLNYANSSRELLKTSISSVFSNYKIEQFLWAHRKFDEGTSQNVVELKKEFSRTRTPPWTLLNEILDEIHLAGEELSVFNFMLTDPSEETLSLTNYRGYRFAPILIDKRSKQPRPFSDLSSGEQILLALAISIFQTATSFKLPSLILLDEIDGSLHPSMSKVLLSTLQKVFVDRNVPVILASHSPSTVAQAPKHSIYVVRKTQTGIDISKETHGNAIQNLTEGFIALSEDTSMLKILPEDKISVLTEGNNAEILTQLLRLHKIKNTIVIRGAETHTGETQIKTFYEMLLRIDHSGKVICVWDCDCKKYQKLEETKKLFRYILPHNPNNNLTNKGIENAFPERVFDSFKITVTPDDGTDERTTFNARKKTEFSRAMANNSCIDDFSHFNGLIEKIKKIGEESTE
jgi:predicted ATP-binding protein involved in virulence